MQDLHPNDFEPEDMSYDAGQYEYYIDDNFEPKQVPGMAWTQTTGIFASPCRVCVAQIVDS